MGSRVKCVRVNPSLSSPYIFKSCIKIKANLNFYFTLLCGASNSFMKASKVLKVFIKLFEVLQSSVKIKILSYFFLFFRDQGGWVSNDGSRACSVRIIQCFYCKVFNTFNTSRLCFYSNFDHLVACWHDM